MNKYLVASYSLEDKAIICYPAYGLDRKHALDSIRPVFYNPNLIKPSIADVYLVDEMHYISTIIGKDNLNTFLRLNFWHNKSVQKYRG